MTRNSLFEMKTEYKETDTFIPNLPLYHTAIRIHDIRKLIYIAKQYIRHKKRARLLKEDMGLMQEILYDYNPQRQYIKKSKIAFSTCRRILVLAESMKLTPLPFVYVKQHKLFNDVVFHLVSTEILETRCCFCFSPFYYAVRNSEYLVEFMVDMANVVYRLNAGAVLVLPEKYYKENKLEDRIHFQRMTEIGLKERLLS